MTDTGDHSGFRYSKLKSIDQDLDALLSTYEKGHFLFIFYNASQVSINHIRLNETWNGLSQSTIICHKDKILQFGGRRSTELSNDIFMFDEVIHPEVDGHHETVMTVETKMKKLQAVGTPPSPRFQMIAASLNHNEIFFHGGTDGNEIFADSYIFNIERREWRAINCKGDIPKGILGQSCVTWNRMHPLGIHHVDIKDNTLPNIILFGGNNVRNEKCDFVFEFDPRLKLWRKIPVRLPSPCSNITSVRIDTQVGLFVKERVEEEYIVWIAQLYPRQKVFRSFMKVKNVASFVNIHQDFDAIYKCILNFDYKDAIQMKNLLLKEMLEKEVNAFFYEDVSMEVLSNTILLKFIFDMLDDFPLYATEAPPKRTLWSMIFGSEKKSEIRKLSDLFFKLPPLFVKIEKTFKSNIIIETKDLLHGLVSFIVGTPFDPKFLDMLVDESDVSRKQENELYSNSGRESSNQLDSKDENLEASNVNMIAPSIICSKEDRNIIYQFMTLDNPLEIYNVLRTTTSMDMLPERYQQAFSLFREKIFEYIQVSGGVREHLSLIKWVRRIMYLFLPIIKTMNPMFIMSKLFRLLLSSNLGRYGISLTLDLKKTEHQIAHKKKEMNTHFFRRIEEYVKDKPYSELDEIRHQYHIKKPLSSLDDFDTEGFEEDFQNHLLSVFHLPKSAKNILFRIPNTLNESQEKSDNIPDHEESNPALQEGHHIESDNATESIDYDAFKKIVFDEILNKSSMESYVNDKDIQDMLELFELHVRYKEKMDFFDFLEESRIQQLILDTFNTLFPPIMKLYGNTDISRVFSGMLGLVGTQVTLLEAEKKIEDKIIKVLEKGEKILSKNEDSHSNHSESIEETIQETSHDTDDWYSMDNIPSEEEIIRKAEEETKRDFLTILNRTHDFKHSISEYPEDIQQKYKELKKELEKEQKRGKDIMYKEFEDFFFKYMSEALTNDYENARVLRSLAAWFSAYLTRMEDKFIDTHEMYYTIPNSEDQRQIFIERCESMLHD